MFSGNTKNVRYRIKGIFFFLCALVLLSSCEPVNFVEREKESVSESSSKLTTADSKSDSIVIYFDPVPYADSYAIKYGETEKPKAKAKASSESSQGKLIEIAPSYDASRHKYYFTISELEMGTSYTIELYAKNSKNTNYVKVGIFEEYTSFADINTAVMANLIRKETQVIVDITNELMPSNMEYKVVLDGKDLSAEKDYIISGSTITISNLDGDSRYKLAIYWKYKDADAENSNWGNKPYEYEIGTLAEHAISLEYNAATGFILKSEDSSALEGFDVISLMYNGKSLLQHEISNKTFTRDEIPSLLNGEFCVELSSSSDAEKKFTTKPITVETGIYITAQTDRQQSSVVSFNVTDDFNASSWRFEVAGSGSTAVGTNTSVKENVATVTLTGFESLSEYKNLRLNAVNGTYTAKSDAFDVNTTSFKGTYIWEAAQEKDGYYAKQFAVRVVESGDACKYHIFASDKDISFTDIDSSYYGKYSSDIQLSPLSENIINDIEYPDSPKGYQWNAKKWNGSEMTPSKVLSAVCNHDGDSFLAIVKTSALIFEVITNTSFEFKEINGVKYLVFYNKITEGIGDGLLLKNPSPNPDIFEKNPDYYTLKWKGTN